MLFRVKQDNNLLFTSVIYFLVFIVAKKTMQKQTPAKGLKTKTSKHPNPNKKSKLAVPATKFPESLNRLEKKTFSKNKQAHGTFYSLLHFYTREIY